jgi:ABC-type branched-subunit amino acid transport system permease subunit
VTRPFPSFLPTGGFTVVGVTVSWEQAISVAIATTGTAALYLFLQRSRLGIAMRAVVDSPSLVSLTGERPVRVRRAAWSIGSAFAALSGILLAPTLGLDALLLTLLVIQAFGAAAFGLFSSLPLTYAGGVGIGILSSVATKYITEQPFNGVPSSIPFLVLIVVLLVVNPRNLPQRQISLRSLVREAPSITPRAAGAIALVGGTGLLLVPVLVGPKLPVWTGALSSTIVFGSLGLLVWTSGQLSLCHAAFVALGATTFGHLTVDAGVPWLVALVAAGLLTVPIGALVAVPAIRLSGIYLALATLGFGILMQNVIYPTSLMFGSALSVTAPRPQFGVVDGARNEWMYYIVLAVAALAALALAALLRSPLGRVLRAMSETPTMLATHGLGVNMTRLTVFCLSAFFAGVGGALGLAQTGAASGVAYGPVQSLMLLATLAICGTRLLPSAILAAGLFTIVPGYLGEFFTVERQIFAFGLTAVLASLISARRSELTAWIGRAGSTSDERVRYDPIRNRDLIFTPARPTPRPGDPVGAIEA